MILLILIYIVRQDIDQCHDDVMTMICMCDRTVIVAAAAVFVLLSVSCIGSTDVGATDRHQEGYDANTSLSIALYAGEEDIEKTANEIKTYLNNPVEIIETSDIIIDSHSGPETRMLNSENDTTPYTKNLDQIVENTDIAIFEESWTMFHKIQYVDTILKSYINGGVPTIVIGNEDYLGNVSQLKSNVMIHTDDVAADCRYFDDSGTEHQYLIIGDRTKDTLKEAIEWSHNISTNEDYLTQRLDLNNSTTNGGDVTIFSIKTISMPVADRGNMSITATVGKFNNVTDPEYDYYSMHFTQYAAPNIDKDYRVADLNMTTTMREGELLLSGPNSTSGTTTVGVNLGVGIGVGSDGVSGSASASYSWSYSVSDVVITNSTVTGIGGTAEINHDISEDKTVGKGYAAEPGILVSKEKTGLAEVMVHTFMVTCKEVEKYLGLVTDYEDYRNAWMGVEYTLYDNDATGYQLGVY